MTDKKKKGVAAIFILIGVIMLWQAAFSLLCDIFGWDNVVLRQIYFFMRDDVPRFVVAIAIIWAGLVMIRGKKDESGYSSDNHVEPGRQPENYIEQDRQPEHYVEPDQQNNQ